MSECDFDLLARFVSQKRENERELRTCTLGEYLRDHVRDDPTFLMNAAGMLSQAIDMAGKTEINTDTDARMRRIFGPGTVTLHNLFADFFGIEMVVEGIVDFFKAAAGGGQYARMALWLYGPAACGKSTLVERLLEGLESSEKPFVAVKGCPLHEHPRLPIPRHIRKRVGLPAEGNPCPVCCDLLAAKDGNWWEIDVEEVYHSESGRCGIGRMTSQGKGDVDALIGSYEPGSGEKGTAGGLRFYGALSAGNRGMVEIAEWGKDGDEALVQVLKDATEERTALLPANRGRVPLDAVIIIHSNEPEWDAFRERYKDNGILSRIHPVRIPYNLRFNEAMRILDKLLKRSQVSYQEVPGVLETLGKFVIGTRLAEADPKGKKFTDDELDVRTRIRNGEVVLNGPDIHPETAAQLTADYPNEGSQGLSDRFAVASVEETLLSGPLLLWWKLEAVLLRRIEKSSIFSTQQRDLFKKRLTRAGQAYRDRLRLDLEQVSIGNFDAEAEKLFADYTKAAELFVIPQSKGGIAEREQKEEERERISFLRSIEEQVKLLGAAAEEFRRTVPGLINKATRNGEVVNRHTIPQLGKGIESLLRNRMRLQLMHAVEPEPDSERGRELKEKIRQALIKAGYPAESLDAILQYAHTQKLFGA